MHSDKLAIDTLVKLADCVLVAASKLPVVGNVVVKVSTAAGTRTIQDQSAIAPLCPEPPSKVASRDRE